MASKLFYFDCWPRRSAVKNFKYIYTIFVMSELIFFYISKSLNSGSIFRLISKYNILFSCAFVWILPSLDVIVYPLISYIFIDFVYLDLTIKNEKNNGFFWAY